MFKVGLIIFDCVELSTVVFTPYYIDLSGESRAPPGGSNKLLDNPNIQTIITPTKYINTPGVTK